MGLLDFFVDAVAGASTAESERFKMDDQHRETNPARAHNRARGGSGFWTGYAGEKAAQEANYGENSKATKRWLF